MSGIEAVSPATGSPSCLQTTSASVTPHRLSHTPPQRWLLQISTFPRVTVLPCSLMSPWLQVVPTHLTPASSLWSQLWFPSGLARQSMSLDSEPRQITLSNQMGPVPSGTATPVRAVAPMITIKVLYNVYEDDAIIRVGCRVWEGRGLTAG